MARKVRHGGRIGKLTAHFPIYTHEADRQKRKWDKDINPQSPPPSKLLPLCTQLS